MNASAKSDRLLGLFRSDPAAAEARIAALPEQERSLVFQPKYGTSETFTSSQLLEMTQLIRAHVPPKDQATQIASLAFRNGKKSFSEAAEFLDAIGAKPAERNAVAMNLALSSYRKAVSQTALDEVRADVQKIAPQQLDAATGHALAAAMLGKLISFDDAAALALHYREAGAGDDLLVHLCDSQGGKDNKAAARLIAGKITDPKKRENLLNQLK